MPMTVSRQLCDWTAAMVSSCGMSTPGERDPAQGVRMFCPGRASQHAVLSFEHLNTRDHVGWRVRALAGVDFGLVDPLVQRLGCAADLLGTDTIAAQQDVCSCSRTRRTARTRTSGENLFALLLMMAPTSQELEHPANPGRFTIVLEPGRFRVRPRRAWTAYP